VSDALKINKRLQNTTRVGRNHHIKQYTGLFWPGTGLAGILDTDALLRSPGKHGKVGKNTISLS